MKVSRNVLLLLTPSLVLFTLLLVFPIANILDESFKTFVSGRIGASKDAPYTLQNYLELLDPAYFFYFVETIRLGLVSSTLALVVAFPLAYLVARQRSPVAGRVAVGFLFCMMFMSTMVRVYALQLTFGPTGFSRAICGLFNLNPNGRLYTEVVVCLGLLHYQIPIASLTLLGTIKNLNPRLMEAAQTLGAARWKVHATVTLPLCIPGLLAAFLISFTLCLSAFVVPMVLGKGKVLFISNLIYSRFSEIANYPSGSAIAISMLLLSLVVIYGITAFSSRRYRGFGG
ncbi:MAG: ABC transporter permease [Deltaproteobacteria bacterium]|jgi:putative spermidine/putrescine transport system permease protein|nr:ABC transporter permease [Deltaproteobacteria bacterium]